MEGYARETPPYLINGDGALKEWAHPKLQDNYNHRHASHVYPVWPGHQINPDDTPKLCKATGVALEKRGDGDLSAHGFMIKLLAATRLKKGPYVQEKLTQFLTGNYFTSSLITHHNPGEIYNTDAINSLPAVLVEMLVYSKPGEIELLPALPSQLTSGSISGIRCRTRAIIKRLEWDIAKNQICLQLTSLADQMVILRYRKGMANIKVEGQDLTFQIDNGQYVNLQMHEGEQKSLSITINH